MRWSGLKEVLYGYRYDKDVRTDMDALYQYQIKLGVNSTRQEKICLSAVRANSLHSHVPNKPVT